jgi:hypothetical protein
MTGGQRGRRRSVQGERVPPATPSPSALPDDLPAALEQALLDRPELIEPFASGYSRIVRDAIAEGRL